ncbi:MAG: tRNA lysidine(34) synthetase TilS [Anaerolineales bacterium]
MHNTLHNILQNTCGLTRSQRLLVGVSGGPDSLALLHALHALGWQVIAAHLDHALRPDSAEDAAAVAEYAAQNGILCIVQRVSVQNYAQANRLSLEEAARAVRYHFLFETAAQHNAAAVLVAHTASDQTETVLMHLLRGSGLAGLSGMATYSLPNAWSNSIPLIRPLLGVWRAQILQYCTQQHLPYRLDPTNSQTDYFRNRLRHEVIPYLRGVNPQIEQALWRTAQTADADYSLLNDLLAENWQNLILEQSAHSLSIRRDALNGLPLALQRMFWRKAAGCLRPNVRDLGFEQVQQAIAFSANAVANARRDWALGLYLFLEGETLYLAEWHAPLPHVCLPQMPGVGMVPVKKNGRTELGNGWALDIFEQDVAALNFEAVFENRDPRVVYFSLKDARGGLWLRARTPGERFTPLGMPGQRVRLADWMTNVKLTRRARPLYPLLVDGTGALVWVLGLRLAHDFRVRAGAGEAQGGAVFRGELVYTGA